MYTPLHVYTGYSVLNSALRIEDYVSAAKKAGFTSLAISDFAVLRGAPEFVHTCNKEGIKPIIGVDFIFNGLLFTFYVKNESGYRNLLRLFFDYNNGLVSLDNYASYTNDLVVVLDTTSPEFKKQFALDKFNYWLVDIQRGVNDFYLGITVEKDDYFHHVKVRNFADGHTYKTVAFPFVQYLKSEDAVIIKMTEAVSENKPLPIKELEGSNYLLSQDEVANNYTPEEINATNDIANSVDFNLISKRGRLLEYKNDLGMTSDEYLHHLVKLALQKTGFIRRHSYVDRAKYELEVISKMGYSDYFLVVADFVNWAKNKGILVGPGRGSGAGSLIAFLLNITIADPIKYKLLFERFLNIERQTMPDLDIDFPDIDRHLVIEYIVEKYGIDHVANIVEITKTGTKQSIRDMGLIYGYVDKQLDLIVSTIDSDLSLRQNYVQKKEFRDLYSSDVYYQEIIKYASKVEGLPRNQILHPVGVVLNADPLSTVIPVLKDKTGRQIEEFEKDYLEEQQFLKFDILPLKNLTIIQDCLTRIKETTGKVINYYDIPWEDKDAINLIASGKTMGLFQLESKGMRDAIRQIKPTEFEDIVAIVALYRPGPMANIPDYAKRKAKLEPVPFVSEALKDILAPTYGIIVYQEQILQIANKVAGFSLGQADLFRRAISKKKEDQLLALKDSFINGCVKNGYSNKDAKTIYDYIYKFADYGYNRSHSLVYAIVACQMAYLKAHYPTSFYASILKLGDYSTKDGTFNAIINEIKGLNIQIKNPDVNNGFLSYTISNGKLEFPLTAIRDLQANHAVDIINERNEFGEYKDFFDFVIRSAKYRISQKEISALINAGAFDSFGKNRTSLRNSIVSAIQYADAICDSTGQMIIDASLLPKPVIKEVESNAFEDLQLENMTLGYMVSVSPLSLVKDKISNIKVTNIMDIENSNGDISLVCVVKNTKTKTTKKGDQMVIATIYDDTGETDVMIFSNVLQTCSSILKKNEIVILGGYYNRKKDRYKLSITSVKKLEEC